MPSKRAARRLAVAAALGLCAVRGASGEQAMPPIEIDEGVSWTLAEHRAATLSDLRYRYHLRIPRAGNAPVTGTVEIRFAWSDPRGLDVVLDFKDPSQRVSAVRANGASIDWAPRHDHVVVPAAALRRGEGNRVELDFEAGDEALNRNDDFLYTLFVPDRAHFSLPLFDQPNLKARFDLTLEAPAGWVAVANGETVEGARDRDASAGPVSWRFAETQPIPTYLFAFAAGRFQVETAERDGRPMRMFHRETDAAKVARNRDAVFDLHAAALDWLEDYTGIPYPFGKFDFVLVPPFQYGGMEHPGSIFYRASSLMLDESATQAAYLGRASLIAHETAHMWFGDLVTMNWFDDVWTKEVFANFLAAKIVHPSFPEVDHDLRFFLAHHQAAYGIDRTAGANPIRQPLENLKEAGALYGPIIYQKAPIVMRHLERLVGEERFRDGLREYLRTFAYANATWPDLIDILDPRTGTDLRSWSAVWVEEPGRPTVTARRESGDGAAAGRLTLAQSDPAERGRVWPQQIELLLDYGDAEVREPLLLSGGAASVDLDRPAPRFVLPNASGVEYGRFRLDEASTAFLMTALPDIADPLTRGIAWGTLWDAVLAAEVPVADWFELLLRGLESEPVEQNAQRLLGYLSTTCWSLMSDAARRAASPRVEAALWAGVTGSTEPTRKAAYFRAWHGLVQTPAGLARLRRIWAEDETVTGVTLSERDFTALAAALAVRGAPGTEEVLALQAARIENPDRLARFEFLRPALSLDPAVRERFFAGLRDAANREREPWVLAGLGYLHHPLRSEHSRQFIGPALDLLVEVQRTGDIFFPAGWLGATLGGHSSAAAADIVRRFLDGLDAGYPLRLRAKILQSADRLFRAARIVDPVGEPGA